MLDLVARGKGNAAIAQDLMISLKTVRNHVSNIFTKLWGFDTETTVPLPIGAAQLALAWLAARNVRPPVGWLAAVLLGAFCMISVVFGLFDGDLITNIASDGLLAVEVLRGFLLVVVTVRGRSARSIAIAAAGPASLMPGASRLSLGRRTTRHRPTTA